jgi:hypothetical protein
MSHPLIENKTRFEFAPVFVTNEEARPLAVFPIKSTYRITSNGLEVSPEQLAVNLTGEYWGDPDVSSYKYEPEGVPFKPATDVALIGHAYAQNGGTRSVEVSLRVGPVAKKVRVVGDRTWLSTFGFKRAAAPEPFERIPLIYERAFGGWDRSNKNPKKHQFEPRNPVGTGFRSRHGKFEEGVRLPNLEEPGLHAKGYHSRPPPTGFGFTSPHWQPRAKLAGTYDVKWTNERMPLLPKDFDPRFFNSASPGLIAPGYLAGNEPVLIENATPGGRLAFNLPGIPAPKCRVVVRGKEDQDLETKLDTLIINTDDNLLLLIWRSNLVLKRGPEDVLGIEIKADGMPPGVLKQ